MGQSMKWVRIAGMGAAIAVACYLFGAVGIAQAHGHVDVELYALIIGFENEPAYAGEPNGLELVVTVDETGEPVSGLEDSLRVEIIKGSAKRELELEPVFGEEGAYTADVIPTEPGDYTWHIFGDIEGTLVDVELTSGPDSFSPVEARSEAAFPQAEATISELEQRVQTATILGGAGVVLGLIGLVVGIMGMRKK